MSFYLRFYSFLIEELQNKDYCLFSNGFIGKRIGLAAKTVSDHLRDLEKGGHIIRTLGPPSGSFEPGAKKVRRIYLSNNPAVSHLGDKSNEDRGFASGIEGGLNVWRKRYADESGDPLVPYLVRQSAGLSPVCKLLCWEIASVFGSGVGDAPLGFYAWALGLRVAEVSEAFSDLYEAGIIWIFETRRSLSLWFYSRPVSGMVLLSDHQAQSGASFPG